MRATVDRLRFRRVLGTYPTGVSVVTAIDADGSPAGMAVGTFTSVSLDPPLVAFLPDRGSSSFPRIRTAASFCVNVLAADQEDLCRAFAARGGDKFAGVAWSPAPSGAPRLHGAAAWVDCDVESITDAGDHFLVLGRVRELDAPRDGLPLLFFRGSYGRFTPHPLINPEVIVPIVADVLAVRLFELVALLLFLFGCWYVHKARSWVVLGGYAGATLTVLFDWTFNTKWFFNVLYSPNFVPLFRIGDTVQPVALLFTYAFFFGIPTAFFALNREWIDRRFGRWGWLLIFVGMGLLQPLFEIPMVSWLHLWTYYQAPGYLIGGVIWSNVWFSGMLGVACYGALRVALRWEAARRPVTVAAGAAAGGTATAVREVVGISEREDRVRAVATGAVAIWAAFYASTLIQLLAWYAVVSPWVESPRQF